MKNEYHWEKPIFFEHDSYCKIKFDEGETLELDIFFKHLSENILNIINIEKIELIDLKRYIITYLCMWANPQAYIESYWNENPFEGIILVLQSIKNNLNLIVNIFNI